MYHPKVTDQQLQKVCREFKVKLQRGRIAYVRNVVDHLSKLVDDKGELLRKLTAEEEKFVTNERLLCKFDFMYWATRYAHIILDKGGIGLFDPWPSQDLVYKVIQNLELKSWTEFQDGAPAVDGICFGQNKARQLGATCHARLFLMHRLTLWEYQRGMSASVDEDKVQELYDRDKTIYDNLPWYLKPKLTFDVKAQHLYFEGLNSRLLYQVSSQKSGLGQGRQFEISHLTECSTWPYPRMIELDFFDTIPRNYYSFSCLESTPYGRGNWWHEFTEAARKGEKGRWHWVYVPWYVNEFKYWAAPPIDWTPNQVTLLHAEMVKETSPDIVGKKVELSKGQLYWYERERAAAVKSGTLNIFITNHSSTPEESFQHTTESAFDPETLEWCRLNAKKGVPYQFERLSASAH